MLCFIKLTLQHGKPFDIVLLYAINKYNLQLVNKGEMDRAFSPLSLSW